MVATNNLYDDIEHYTFQLYLLVVGLVGRRTCGSSDLWVVGLVGRRTCGPSDLWVVGLVGRRTCGTTPTWVL